MTKPPFTEEAVLFLVTVFASASGSLLQPSQAAQVLKKTRQGLEELASPDSPISPAQKEELSRLPALLDRAIHIDRVETRDPPSDQIH